MKKAVVLFSGGLDSSTLIAIAKAKGYECFALSFDYGQRHKAELDIAKATAKAQGLSHLVFPIAIDTFGASSLTDKSLAVPKGHDPQGIPNTYVPARNTIFLSVALSYAEAIGAHDIFIGVSAIDYSNYPDCRPEFIEAFERMANLGTKAQDEGQAYTIHTPLIALTKAQTILKGIALGVDYAKTVSCYQLNENYEACGVCPSCILRRKGFEEAQVVDPTRYLKNEAI